MYNQYLPSVRKIWRELTIPPSTRDINFQKKITSKGTEEKEGMWSNRNRSELEEVCSLWRKWASQREKNFPGKMKQKEQQFQEALVFVEVCKLRFFDLFNGFLNIFVLLDNYRKLSVQCQLSFIYNSDWP